MEQGSIEWRQARLGKVTASRIWDVICKTRTGYSVKRERYMMELLAERLTGQEKETYQSEAMLHGIINERAAKHCYTFYCDQEIVDASFILHPTIRNTGASPDGFVGSNGLIEIKCPNTENHLEFFLNRVIPKQYIAQMQWQMVCAKRKWCDFVSFDPRLPEKFKFTKERVMRDDKYIAEMEDEVNKFLNELNQIENMEEKPC